MRIVEVIPGKSTVGLEIPNEKRELVTLGEIIKSKAYDEMTSPLALVLGKDISGAPVVADLARMPHLLVGGTTGSGKSTAVNAMVLSLLYKATAEHVRLIMIDPKMLELSVYEGIPHLLAPVVTDMKEAANALRWCVAEMERRYQLMAALGVRNLAGFNRKLKEAQEAGQPIRDPLLMKQLGPDGNPNEVPLLEPLPFIVVIVDELADMMMIVGKKVEELIARLAQKARASGIHLILATQRPSVDVITGLIKANIPTRIAFQVSAKVDSRTILDQMGAEQLLGHGDMLFLQPGTSVPIRVHGAFVSDQEVHRVVGGLRGAEPNYMREILEGPSMPIPGHARRAGRSRRGSRGRDRRRAGSAVRPGRAHRGREPQGLDLRRAAAPEDRLQPRRAHDRDDGGGRPRRAAAVQRHARSSVAGASRRVIQMKSLHCARLAGALIFLAATASPAFGAAAPTPQAGRQRVEAFLQGLDGLQAQFKQILTDRNGRSIDEASGTLAISRPDRFRWDYREPYQQVIVADGARIWIYDSDLEQVTVRKLDETLSATPAMLLSGRSSLADNFNVTQVAQEGTVEWVRMEPKRDDTDFKWVRLGFEGALLKYMQLADKLGQTTSLEFSKLERNPPLDPSRFTFTVPPGADVIGDASSASAPARKP